MTFMRDRHLIASLVVAFVVALTVHLAIIVAFLVSSLASSTSTSSLQLLSAVSNYFTFVSIAALILLFAATLFGALGRWWTALITGLAVGILSAFIGTAFTAITGGSSLNSALLLVILNTLIGINLLYIVAMTVLVPTFGRWLYRTVTGAPSRSSFALGETLALVRVPAPGLADEADPKNPVDSDVLDEQWDAYVAAFADAGWRTVEVPSADAFPLSTFVGDMACVFGQLAVITRPVDNARLAERDAAEASLRAAGLSVERIEEPGTLDGGDILVVGRTVYVGRSSSTNAEAIRQLRALLSPRGYMVVAHPIASVSHLSDAAGSLPDGTILGYVPALGETGVFDRFVSVPEPEGTNVVTLDSTTVLMSEAATASIELVKDRGYDVISVNVSEFEKLGRPLTSLSIRLR